MIVCPNCSHSNPEGALNCEACYTALPATKACPSCGASIQLDATFCGQCGHNLKPAENQTSSPTPAANVISELPATVLATSQTAPDLVINTPAPEIEPLVAQTTPSPVAITEPNPQPATPPVTPQPVKVYHLLHLQTNTTLEVPSQLEVVYLGKPNDKYPPNIDVSGFPCSEVVSRIHASIGIEGEDRYIEDLGSANGTYINHNTLAKGNRHVLRAGDRISLGKGDLVTFIFQITQ